MSKLPPIADKERLYYRRQFILAPRSIDRFPSWQTCKINEAVFLTVHPDLPLHRVEFKGRSLTLMGFLLDPDHPEADDRAILNELIKESQTGKQTIVSTHSLGGRWILIFDDGKESILFNDASGCRQAYYYLDKPVGIWCASQPGLMASELGLEIDPEARRFADSPEFKGRTEHWWPGDSSLYEGVKKLWPNYYLDLRTGQRFRFWPKRRISNISHKEVLDECLHVLKGLVKSASKRFGLALSITGGWDSRLILSLTKEISNDVFYYTLVYRDLTEDHPDVVTPSSLLHRLGLKHHVIRCPSQMDNEFRDIYMSNVVTAHKDWGKIAQGLYQFYPQGRVTMKGVVSEIARHYPPYTLAFFETFTEKKLARMANMGRHPFAVKAFRPWLSEARKVSDTYNVRIGDLFLIEQKLANWYGMSQLEWDIVQDVFEPYNCRALIRTVLSADPVYTRQPYNRLYREIITHCWPEALSEPINPKPFSLKSHIKSELLKTNFYSAANRAVTDLRERLQLW